MPASTETVNQTETQPEDPQRQIATVPMPPGNSVQQAAIAPREFSRVTMEHLAQLPDDDNRRAWINSLVEAEVARQTFAYHKALAREFALSGQFSDITGTTMEQAIATAIVKIQMGAAWGFNPADSIRYIYFANGRPAIENEIVASKLQQAGFDWDIEWLEETVQHKNKPWKKCVGCTLWLKRWNKQEQCYKAVTDRNGQPISVSFTEADADHAMIWEKGKQVPLSSKWNFVSWARDMFYWRAISRVKKYHAPHVLRGAWLKEEALEIIPDDVAQGMIPSPDAGTGPATVASSERPTLRDRILKQPSFLDPEPQEPVDDAV